MPILLSDDELEALEGLPHLHRCLYIFGIRRYMDYQTGTTGIKRKISYKSLSEETYVEPHQGLKNTGANSKEQIRRVVKSLEKAGLITIKSSDKNLILECILAKRDKSVQNKPDTNPTPQPDTQANIIHQLKNSYKNRLVQAGAYVKPDPQADIPQNGKADTHPVSVDLIRLDLRGAILNLLEMRHFTVAHLIHNKTVAMLKVLEENKFTIEEIEAAMQHADAQLGTRPKVPWYYLDPILQKRAELEYAREKANRKQEDKTHETDQPRTALPDSAPRNRTGEGSRRMAAWVKEQERLEALEAESESD